MLRRRRLARPLHFSVLRLAAAAATMLVALPAAARPLEVVTAPDHATWQDSIEVTVSGVVETACGPEVMTLTVEQTGPDLVVVALQLGSVPSLVPDTAAFPTCP